jgi:hypothetical protein
MPALDQLFTTVEQYPEMSIQYLTVSLALPIPSLIRWQLVV